MRKPDKSDIFIITFVLFIFLIAALFAVLTSCQPKDDILKNAEFPCECTYKGWDYEIHLQCQDSLYKFRDENYYRVVKEGETINKRF